MEKYSSANIANLSANRRLYAQFVGKFIVDTPWNRTSSDGPEKANTNNSGYWYIYKNTDKISS